MAVRRSANGRPPASAATNCNSYGPDAAPVIGSSNSRGPALSSVEGLRASVPDHCFWNRGLPSVPAGAKVARTVPLVPHPAT